MDVMVEVLSVLAIATKEVKQSRASKSSHRDKLTLSADCIAGKILRRLVGRADMENALQRLDNIMLEETRMIGVQTWKAIHDFKHMTHDSMLDYVRARDVGNKVINSAQSVLLPMSSVLIVYMVRRRENWTTDRK